MSNPCNQTPMRDDFFDDELTAIDLVARLIETEKRGPAPRSSGISMVIVIANGANPSF